MTDLKQMIFDFYVKEMDKTNVRSQMIHMYEAMNDHDSILESKTMMQARFEVLDELVHYFADSVFEEMFEKAIKEFESGE